MTLQPSGSMDGATANSIENVTSGVGGLRVSDPNVGGQRHDDVGGVVGTETTLCASAANGFVRQIAGANGNFDGPHQPGGWGGRVSPGEMHAGREKAGAREGSVGTLGDMEGATLVRTLALSNFGNRPAVLEVSWTYGARKVEFVPYAVS